MEVVALIPARGGSKAIPRKNLAPLGGRPLLAWAVDAARESQAVTRTLVSTDDGEIAETARGLGAEVLDRPPELAADETPMRDVIEHAVRELPRADVLVLLQPTSPLRRARHVDEAVELLLTSGADSVVSVVEVPHRYRPGSLMALDGDRLVRLADDHAATRQEKPLVYARNGPAILALRADRIGPDLYGGDCRAYVMEQRDSVDVDDPFDLELAELLLAAAR
ncbi:MAG TPA: acylneuraminate cytidylyltransferase family protein [Gaiellaceae bacterium]|nr:acylneuraminate cytidylyltransferase family protein [Gaiellaceae bacterium]